MDKPMDALMNIDDREARQLDMYGLAEIRIVASRLATGITGTGKTDWATRELVHALAYGCPYCHGRIMLDNGTIDHKEPIGSALRNAPAASQARKYADRPENLHIICKPCNQLKGDFTHDEYMQLRAFLAGKEQLEMKLRRRLSQTASFFKMKRHGDIAKGKRPMQRRRGNFRGGGSTF